MKSLTKFKFSPSWLWIGAFFGIVAWFGFPVAQGKIPIPADTILGMYHPWRDQVWDGLTQVPFKNFLITDPVRQQLPWKELAVSLLRQGELPLWNPYTFSGTPLLANFQAAPFYPLNLLFFLLPIKLAWTIYILSQQILGGIFLYAYLRFLRLRKPACILGSLAWVFSGFFIAWWEWGNIGHTVLWLPLILLSIDKIVEQFNACENSKLKTHASAEASAGKQNSKLQLKSKNLLAWSAVFVSSLVSSFLAGHLQVSFYALVVSLIYLIAKLTTFQGKKPPLLKLFIIHYSLFIILTAFQWLPTLEFIFHSARTFDQPDWLAPNWFLPVKHLVQFIAPDFFGNPATLNYWGEWNYGEFVGYLGLIPLIFAFLALFWRRDKKTLFFSLLVLASLIFVLPTPLAKLPYQLKIPFFSTSRPTRLMAVIDFGLAVLAALGLDWILGFRIKDGVAKIDLVKKIGLVVFLLGLVLVGLWSAVFGGPKFWPQALWLSNLIVTKRNLILPTILFFGSCGVLAIFFLSSNLQKLRRFLLFTFYFLLFTIVAFDLVRFGRKFTPFVKADWLFPTTETIEFLQSDPEVFRLMAVDRRIFPPNFSIVYHLQTVDGYDPLYLQRYGQLVAAWERKEPDISPFSFNRIVRPGGFESRLADLLNVKYVLSLTDLESEKLELVFQEGETRVYRNKEAFSRAFWAPAAVRAENDQEVIDFLFDPGIDLRRTVVLEKEGRAIEAEIGSEGKVIINDYQENKVVLETDAGQGGWVVLTDSFYPGWKAEIDGEETKIFRADFAFRAVEVPEGRHKVVFSYQPKSFRIGVLLSAVGIACLVLVLRGCLRLNESSGENKDDKRT